MRRRRYLAPWARAAVELGGAGGGAAAQAALKALEGKPALYHCISRVVDRRFILGEEERARFTALLRACEAFCRVRVLTFCVMSNHFHILVEVPARPAQEPSDEDLLGHLGVLYNPRQVAGVRRQLEHFRRRDNHAAAEALRRRFLARMWDLPAFMQNLKQRFSQWYNGREKRDGCLWGGRFKSVLVEDGHAARVVAAYIDLNPVRAGMVAKPEDYRWSGWGEAAAGKKKAREGLARVMLEHHRMTAPLQQAAEEAAEWRKVAAGYRELLEHDRETGQAGREGGARSKAAARRGRPARPRLTEAGLLSRKVRYFSDGLVLGSRGFVESVFELTREWFAAGRRNGARRLARADTPLRVMRALRVRRYGTESMPRPGPDEVRGPARASAPSKTSGP